MSQRGYQLVVGAIAMIVVSSPQYVWALFVQPVQESFGATLAVTQITIMLFSVASGGFGPLHGYLAGRTPIRWFIAAGVSLVGLSWVISSFVESLPWFYLSYGLLSGVGTGMVTVAVTNHVSRWFPDRRGLAIGVVAGSYGMGAIFTTIPISAAISAYGFRSTLLTFGIVFGVIGLLTSLGFKEAEPLSAKIVTPSAPIAAGKRNYTPREMLKTPAFWLLFSMMTMVGTGGLMAISNIAVFGREFGIANMTVLGISAIPLALTVDRIANGLSRPLFGWISDFLGRERTMALAFVIAAAATLLLLYFGSDPVLFVLLTGLVFLAWGEIFSLFPSAQADRFGTQYGAQNFGILFVSVAVASLLGGPLAAAIFEATGSWNSVFYSVAALDLIAAALAVLVLQRMPGEPQIRFDELQEVRD